MATSLLANLSDLQAAQLSQQGLYEAVCTNPLDTSNVLFEEEFNWIKATADVNATDATTEFVLGWMPRRAKVVSANYTPNAAGLTSLGGGTFSSLIVSSRPGNTTGGITQTLAQAQTFQATSGGTGNWAQWVPVAFTVNAFDPTNNVVPAGGIVTFAITKTGAGVVTPAGTLQVRVQFV
jgi:hypothetical protein